MATGTIISLGLYFVVMLGIGLFAYRQTDTNVEGYMLGGRQLGPAVTALSAGASDMSGWMLMGLPGAMYVSGLSAGWIAVGLTLGALANYMLVAPRLRVYTEVANNSITLPDYFENRFADNTRLLRVIASVVIVVFFTLYTSSGVCDWLIRHRECRRSLYPRRRFHGSKHDRLRSGVHHVCISHYGTCCCY